MAESASERSAPPGGGVTPDPHQDPRAGSDEHAGGSPCPVAWCPICIAVGAVQPLRPDVVEHLLKAGTEMLLAFRAVVDDRADDVTGTSSKDDGSTRLEKIELG